MGEGLQLHCTVSLWRNAALQIRLFGFLSESGNSRNIQARKHTHTKDIPASLRHIWLEPNCGKCGFMLKVSGFLQPLKHIYLVQQLFIFGSDDITLFLLLQACKLVRLVFPQQRLNMRIIKDSAWLSDLIHPSFTSRVSLHPASMTGKQYPRSLEMTWHTVRENWSCVLLYLKQSLWSVVWLCSVRPMAATSLGIFFPLQHMTSSHGFIMTHCPITCTNLIKNTI